MKNMTPRQRYLYLSAKLYELAAEFTDSDLIAMLRERSTEGNAANATNSVIRALMDLHRSPSERSNRHIDYEMGDQGNQSQPPSQQASSLLALLEDRSAFPSVAGIAAVVGLPARPKEARNRYIARVIRQVEAMTKQDRANVFEGLAIHLNRQPESFISKWSKVIKDT
jgi:hypothetical protein